MGLAHQLDQPGVGSDGFGQQLRLLLQFLLAIAQRQALHLMLLGDLQVPQVFPLVEGKAAENAEENRQSQAAKADDPVDRAGHKPLKHLSAPSSG